MYNQPLKKLSQAAQAVLDEWLGRGEILHVWVHEEAIGFTVYTVVAQYSPESPEQLGFVQPPPYLRFFRLFPMSGKYQISCDREVEVSLDWFNHKARKS